MPSFLSEIHAFMYRDGTPQELNEEQEALGRPVVRGRVRIGPLRTQILRR